MSKYKPSLVGIDNDLAFSKKSVWVYASLPAQPYEFMGATQREQLAQSIEQGLGELVKNGTKSIECMLTVTSVPFDHETWAEALAERTYKIDPSNFWDQFSHQMEQHIHTAGFRTKEVYLSIMVGKRTDYQKKSAFGPLSAVMDGLNSALGFEDPNISDEELEYWHKEADKVRRIINHGSLKAKPVKANTIARLVKESLWPGMSVPDVSASNKESWGQGEIDGVAVADITNHKKFLRIEQVDDKGRRRVGYRATLCFSRFPDTLHFPEQEPWMHFASTLSSPSTIYSRFTIVPAQKVAKDVERMAATTEDQINNANGKATLAQYEQRDTAEEVKYRLSRNRMPWIYGRHRIILSGQSEDHLQNLVQEAQSHYKELDIDLTWSTGDQMNLLLESQPADKVRVSSYFQRQELGIIPIGMPTASGGAGDAIVEQNNKKFGWLGPYVGYTTSRVEEPVFVSLHSAISQNNPPGCVIIGSPGGGKSFFAFTLTYIMALQGVWTIYIDPKGDALTIPNLPGLEGRVKTFDLKYGNDGLLDPFTLSNNLPEQQLLALETIKLFLGGHMNAEQEAALMLAIGHIAEQPHPTLNRVVDFLLARQDASSFALGNTLKLIRQLPFARLCFSDHAGRVAAPFRPEDGLTIISLQSLDLPATSDRSTYTTPNHLAVGIMYLLAHYTESLMNSTNKDYPKAVVIDEAWAITSTPQGANMIPRLARMGRALNTALILVSQNADDFMGLTNNMSYRFAFRTKDKEETKSVLRFFDLDPESPANMATINKLENGECLVKDPSGRIARVKIDAWNSSAKQEFDTNPETRGKHKEK